MVPPATCSGQRAHPLRVPGCAEQRACNATARSRLLQVIQDTRAALHDHALEQRNQIAVFPVASDSVDAALQVGAGVRVAACPQHRTTSF